MPWWLILFGLALAIALGLVVLLWLFGEADRGGESAALRIEAIRTSLTVVAGTGAAIALVLAARRQWLSERRQRHDENVAAESREHELRVQDHHERVASMSALDMTERRLADLFSRAVEELGSESIPVRFGGLYSLERLAQDYPEHRLAVVEVLCAYLRTREPYLDQPEETEVHRTVQHILGLHAKARSDKHWPGIHLYLPRSRLHNLSLAGAVIPSVSLSAANLSGRMVFADAVLAKRLGLWDTVFEAGYADFDRADLRYVQMLATRFRCPVTFRATTFGPVELNEHTSFEQDVAFDAARFTDTMTFDGVRFGGPATFNEANFEQGASFEHAHFDGPVWFRGTQFSGIVMARRAEFHADVSFEGAEFRDSLSIDRAVFHQNVLFGGATISGLFTHEQMKASRSAEREWPPGYREVVLDDTWVTIEPIA